LHIDVIQPYNAIAFFQQLVIPIFTKRDIVSALPCKMKSIYGTYLKKKNRGRSVTTGIKMVTFLQRS